MNDGDHVDVVMMTMAGLRNPKKNKLVKMQKLGELFGKQDCYADDHNMMTITLTRTRMMMKMAEQSRSRFQLRRGSKSGDEMGDKDFHGHDDDDNHR